MLKSFLLITLIGFIHLSESKELKINKISDLSKKIYETSGLALLNDLLITHNDGGHKPELFVLNTKGILQHTIKVNNAKNIDWEDITTDRKGNLYIGDFGNNSNNRTSLNIYKIKSGFLKQSAVSAEIISFVYEDQKKYPPKKGNLNFDCEAIICIKNKLFLFTKCRTKPYTGISKIYMLPNKPGNYEAKLLGQFNFCKKGWMTCSITAADYHPQSNKLVLLTYGKLIVIKNFQYNAFWKGNIKTYKIPKIRQREAICFINKNSWFITDEDRTGVNGGNLYKVKLD